MNNFYDNETFEYTLLSLEFVSDYSDDIKEFFDVFKKNDIEKFSMFVFGVFTKKSKKIIYYYFKDLVYDEIFSEDVLYEVIAKFYKLSLLRKAEFDINNIYSAVSLQKWSGRNLELLRFITLESIVFLNKFYSENRVSFLLSGIKYIDCNVYADTIQGAKSLMSSGYNLGKIFPKKPKYITEIHDKVDRFSRKISVPDFDLEQRDFIVSLDGLSVGSLKVRVPKTQSDLFDLGEDLNFCIGNGAYGRDVRSGKSAIVAVYKNNKPKYGIELGRYHIKQAWGHSNSVPDKNDIALLKEYILEKIDFNGEFINVDNSFIDAVAYDKNEKQICISISDKKYIYSGVEVDVFEEFMEAESMGAYFSKNIKPKYEFYKVE